MQELKSILSNSKLVNEIKSVISNQNENIENRVNPIDTVLEVTLDDVIVKYDEWWWQIPHLRKVNFALLMPLSACCLNGYDSNLLNGFQAMDHWVSYLDTPTGAVLGALTNGCAFGYLMSIWIARYVSDKYGRKICMYWGALVLTIGIILQTCAVNYSSFIVSRIVIGCGLGFYFIAAPALITEIAYPKYRAIGTCFFNSCWYLGGVVAGWITYSTRVIDSNWSWRIPVLAQIIFPIFHVLCLRFTPESPRYLVSIGKVSEAREVLMKYHGGNNESIGGPLVDFELREIKATITMEQESNSASFKTFFSTGGNILRFFICCFMGYAQYSIGLFAIAYYLNPVLETAGITSTDRKLLVAACLAVFNFVISFFASILIDLCGRRKMFLFNLACLLVIYVTYTVMSAYNEKLNFENKSLGNAILAFLFFAFIPYDMGFMGLPFLYLTEILPFSLRSRGLLIFMISTQFTVIFNGFITPVAMDAISWKFYIVYCCSIALCFVLIYFFFPETSGYSLEEVALVFGDKIEFESVSDSEDTSNLKKN